MNQVTRPVNIRNRSLADDAILGNCGDLVYEVIRSRKSKFIPLTHRANEIIYTLILNVCCGA